MVIILPPLKTLKRLENGFIGVIYIMDTTKDLMLVFIKICNHNMTAAIDIHHSLRRY